MTYRHFITLRFVTTWLLLSGWFFGEVLGFLFVFALEGGGGEFGYEQLGVVKNVAIR